MLHIYWDTSADMQLSLSSLQNNQVQPVPHTQLRRESRTCTGMHAACPCSHAALVRGRHLQGESVCWAAGVRLPSFAEQREQGLPVSEGGLMHSWEHGEWSPRRAPGPLLTWKTAMLMDLCI